MSLLRNIEIWNNQRPRVCNFDLEDYCVTGTIGNTCTNNPRVNEDFSDVTATAGATYDAWLKALNEWFLSTIAFYYDTSAGYEQTIMTKCISLEDFNNIVELYYGESGFLGYYKKWYIIRKQYFNAMENDPYAKETGIVSYSSNIFAPIGQLTTWNYTVDYTDWQTPDNEKYLAYRNAMGDMMQALKKLMQTMTGSSFEMYYPQ